MTRVTPVRRTLAALAVAPLLSVGLVACGDDDSSAGQDDTSLSSSSSEGAGDQPEEGSTIEPADFVQTVSDGVEASTTAQMTMEMSLGTSGSITAEGDVDYTTDPPSMAMTMEIPALTGGDGEMDIRLVDGTVYLSMGQVTQGKFWKVDPADPDGPLSSLGMDQLMDQMNPAKALEAMEEGITEVTYVGEEDDLDHYALTVDLEKMMAAMGSDMPPAAEGQMPDTVSYDVWLDEEDRISKMSMDDLPMGGSSSSLKMTVSDWGEDVDIEAPPADQVTDMPDLGSMMQGSTPGAA